MRVLIIDHSKRSRGLLRRFMSTHVPDARLTTYDPERKGRPAADFAWSTYDLLFLSNNLPDGQSGIDWLRDFQGVGGFPPTVILTNKRDARLEEQAVKAGAHAVLSKRKVSRKKLEAVIHSAAMHGRTSAESDAERRTTEIDAKTLRDYFRQSKRQEHRPVDSGYRFVRLIGQGAMTRVYLAERLGYGSTLVLKILDTSQALDQTMVQRFAQEAELVSRIDSPYVVKVYEQGFTNKYGFIAMEFFSRGDLKQQIELGSITPYDALLYTLNIAYGLKAIHAVGIVHRDLKPANIMFRGNGSLALADFGISRRMGADTQLTSVGELLGTPHYMSPEQFQSNEVDKRSDLYNLGIILYEMLTGSKPFEGGNLSVIGYQHLRAEFPVLPEGFSCFQVVLSKLTAKDPAYRYQDAAELILVLEELFPCVEQGGTHQVVDDETVQLPED